MPIADWSTFRGIEGGIYMNFDVETTLNDYCGNEMRKLKKICYPILSKIGGITELDYDDFYSIANMTVYSAVKQYDETKNDNFELFLTGCIERKFKTEMTRRNRCRRIPQSMIDRLDQPVNEDGETTFGDLIKGEFDWDFFINNVGKDTPLDRYLNSLSKTQKSIAILSIKGYDLPDIQQILGIDSRKFQNCLTDMKSFNKRLLLVNKQ